VKELYQKKDISYYSHTRTELLPYVPANLDTVLDVGCASGNFGHMLKELYGCSVWGIEPDKKSAKAAQEKLDRVFNAQFDRGWSIPDGQKFDCIFFNDVLEHMPQPDEALLLASTLLTDGGHIVASIPNIRFFPVTLSLIRYKDFKYLDAGVMDKTHLRFFTEKSIIRLFQESGYKVNVIEGINRHKFRYFEVLNKLLFNKLQDMRYPQYAIVAQLK
jgi:2-polyprenyl-3-methyl-5-hydroxy-6-metoxy-1,4-benzoquinol methylase